MDINQIKELIDKIENSSIQSFVFTQGYTHLDMKKYAWQAKDETLKNQIVEIKEIKHELQEDLKVEDKMINKEDKDLHIVKSPIVGTYYSAPNQDSKDFVNEGQKIKSNDVVGIIEAMKIMNEIQAGIDGEIVEIFVQNEDIVEYDQPLMSIRKG